MRKDKERLQRRKSAQLQYQVCVCLSVCLSVYLSLCLCICLSVCVSLCLSVCLSVCLSISLSMYLSVCLSVYLSVCVSVCMYVCMSACTSFRKWQNTWSVFSNCTSYFQKQYRRFSFKTNARHIVMRRHCVRQSIVISLLLVDWCWQQGDHLISFLFIDWHGKLFLENFRLFEFTWLL